MDVTLGSILVIGAVVFFAWAIFKRLFRVAIIALVLMALGAWLLLA